MLRRFTALAVVGLLALAADPAGAWMRRITGSRVLVDDGVVATTVDSHGDLIVRTSSTADPGGYRVRVTKRDADTGRALWSRWLDFYSYGTALAVDAHDDVVVGLGDFTVLKLDGRTGDLLWRANPDPKLPWFIGDVYGLAIDAAGDVIAVGAGGKSEDDPGDTDFAVEKLDGRTGTLAWHFIIDGGAEPCDPNEDYCEDRFSTDGASAVAIDADGRVVVAGGVQRGVRNDLTVVALDDASGAVLWRVAEDGAVTTSVAVGLQRIFVGGITALGEPILLGLDPSNGLPVGHAFLGPAGDRVWALAPLRNGDVIVAGTATDDGGAPVVFTTRLQHWHLRPVWRREFPYSPSTLYLGNTIALANDADRALTLLASTSSPDGAQSLLARLDPVRGDVEWTTSMPTRLRAIAALERGDLVVGGEEPTSPTNLDAMLARLVGSNGGVRWHVTEDGIAKGEDDAAGVAIDASGDLFVAGTVENAYSAGYDALTVVRLARRTGEQIWRREIDGMSSYFPGSYDAASGITLDSAGDPIAIGVMDNLNFEFDAAVVKLDGATGVERWRTLLHTDGVHDRDGVYGAAIDAHDDILLLARLNDATGHPVPTIVKLDGATGTERWRRPVLSVQPSGFGVTPLAITRDGAAVVGVYDWNPLTQRFDTVLVACDAGTGRDRWTRIVPNAQATALGVDAAGRIVVAASATGEPAGSDVVLVVFDAGGRELGRTLVTTPDLRPGFATALAFDDEGGAAVIGEGGDPWRGFAVRVDARGEVLWQQEISGAPGSTVAYGGSVAIGPDGGVVAGFTTVSPESGLDMLLVGLTGPSGAERWRRIVDGDASDPDLSAGDAYYNPDQDILRALAIGPQGDVVAVGMTSWTDTGKDFTVVDLQGRSGRDRPAPRWGRCETPAAQKKRGKRPRFTLVCDAARGRARRVR